MKCNNFYCKNLDKKKELNCGYEAAEVKACPLRKLFDKMTGRVRTLTPKTICRLRDEWSDQRKKGHKATWQNI